MYEMEKMPPIIDDNQYEILEKTFLFSGKCHFTTLKYYPICVTLKNVLSFLDGKGGWNHVFEEVFCCSSCRKNVSRNERIFVKLHCEYRSSISSHYSITCFTCYTHWENHYMSFIIFTLRQFFTVEDVIKRLIASIYSLLKRKLVFSLPADPTEENWFDDTIVNDSSSNRVYISNINKYYDLLRLYPSLPLPSSISTTEQCVIFKWRIDERKLINLIMFHPINERETRAYIVDYDPFLSLAESNLFKCSSAWFNDCESAFNDLVNNPNWLNPCGYFERIDRVLTSMIKSVK